ncbi:MAG: WD40 repeat domain-containing protein [Planctomycetaceae bacterium]|nr:WD40 repeat domain-containing protein [Planctomycetaceae bacterium]
MVDFFVRENPLLPLNKKERKQASPITEVDAPNVVASDDSPALLDYGEFGFPDEQVVREWTLLGCISVIAGGFVILAGLGILGITVWNVYRDHMSSSDSVEVLTQAPTQEFKRSNVKAYSVDCKWNSPTAVALTPDGLYMITAGGRRTHIDPLDSLPMARSRESTPEKPWEDLDQLENHADDDDVMKKNAQDEQFLSYDSRTSQMPAPVYVDRLLIDKNGKRAYDPTRSFFVEKKETSDVGGSLSFMDDLEPGRSSEAEKETDGDSGSADMQDLLLSDAAEAESSAEAETASSTETGIQSDDLLSFSESGTIDDLESLESLARDSVWKKTRPSVESYPIAFWSTETLQPIVVHWNHEYPITAIAISPEGNQAVSVDSGGNAILWSLDSRPGENGLSTQNWYFVRKMTADDRKLQGMGKINTIHAVTFTPSGRQFVMAATVNKLDDTGNPYTSCGALILWDIENWKEVLRKRGTGGLSKTIDTYYQTLNPVGKFTDLAFTPNGKYLLAAAAGANAGVYYFDNRTSNPAYGICMADMESDEQRPRMAQNSEFKPNLVQGLSRHDFPNADHVALAISPKDENSSSENDSLTVVSADNLGRIVFWDFAPKTNRPREGVKRTIAWNTKNTENTTQNIRKVLFSRDQKYVLFLGDEFLLYHGKAPHGYMGNFRTKEGTEEESTDIFLISAYFTPDNKYLLGGSDDCRLRMWRMDELPLDVRFSVDMKKNENAADKEESKEDPAEDDRSLDDLQKEFKLEPQRSIPQNEEDADWDALDEKKESQEWEAPLDSKRSFTRP